MIIGVDSSTTATKVIAFDLEGRVVAEASDSYPTYSPRPGWVEQDADRWWTAFSEACREVTASISQSSRRGRSLGDLEGIAFTHQRFSFVPVDADMQPLRRAILWNDLRCQAEAEAARERVGANEIFRRTGYPPGQWTLYKAMWLAKHEPEVYRKTAKLLLVPDLIAYRLTGALATSQSSAAMTGALDIERPSRWAVGLIRDLEVRPDVWVDDIVPAGARLGTVSVQSGAATGLPEGLPVFAAGGDQPCGSLGAGAIKPGQLAINGGTSCSNEFIVDSIPDRREPVYFIEISPTGNYIVENDIPSGGSAVMRWYRERFGEADLREAEITGRDPWEVIYGAMAETEPGNRGFIVVPYLQGVYGPYWDQNARGVAIGLQSDHTRKHLVRALLEGVAYEARREVEFMRRIGESPRGVTLDDGTRNGGTSNGETALDEIRMYGGSARSAHWNQLFADVFDVPVAVPSTPETTALGAAICAAVGAGVYSSYDQATTEMVCVESTYKPDPEVVPIYDRYYNEVYRGLYDSVRDLVQRTAAISRDIDKIGESL